MSDNTLQLAKELVWRFAKGSVISVQENIAHLAVSIPNHPEIKRARLIIELQQNKEVYAKGSRHPLFIVHPTQSDRGLYHAADGPMADPKLNPWSTKQIRNGDIIEGVVVDYVDDYAVIVTLSENISQGFRWRGFKKLTGFLHIADTPEGRINKSANVRIALHIGDTIQAMISSLNSTELQIHLDVNGVIDIREREAKQIKVSNNPPSRLLPNVSIEPQVYPEKRMLLIDDDRGFCGEQQNLLRHWNVKVRFCHNLIGLQRELIHESFDACLLDCDLGLSEHEQYEMMSLIKETQTNHPNMHFAFLTGDDDLRQSQTEPVFSKPLRVSSLLTWLNTGEITTEKCERRTLFTDKGRRWQIKGAEAFVIERARLLMAHCCQKINAHFALWIKQERAGYFVVRVSHNVTSSQCRNLEKQFQNSHVATAIDRGIEQEVEDYKSGPLFDNLGKFGYVWIMPFGPDEKPDRALLLFSDRRLEQSAKDYIRDQRLHLIDITHLMNATLALESSEVFAIAGLLLSSNLHEIRTKASIVAGRAEHLTELLNRPLLKPSEDELREDLTSLIDASQRLLELSEAGLDSIRPSQGDIPDLLALLEKIRHQMQGRMKSLRTHATLGGIRCELDRKKPISLTYPQKFVEIPLINLIDNALLHCGARDWAKVEISLEVDTQYTNQPLLIRVEDNGLGMTSGQRSQLFNPRKTSRGLAGSGIGLYLSKQLIESIGGSIELEKTVRWLGTSFIIRLPQVG